MPYAVLPRPSSLPSLPWAVADLTTLSGWWAMHCHLVDHSEMGMVAALHVGRPEDLPPIPEGFPTCGSFMPDF